MYFIAVVKGAAGGNEKTSAPKMSPSRHDAENTG